MGTGGRELGGVVGGWWCFTRLTVVRCSVAVSVGMGVRATHCAPIRVRTVEALARSGAVEHRERDLAGCAAARVEPIGPRASVTWRSSFDTVCFDGAVTTECGRYVSKPPRGASGRDEGPLGRALVEGPRLLPSRTLDNHREAEDRRFVEGLEFTLGSTATVSVCDEGCASARAPDASTAA